MSKEREGRVLALGTMTEKGLNVVKSAAGERIRSAFIVSGNKPIIIATSTYERPATPVDRANEKWFQSHENQIPVAKYTFAYVLVNWPTQEIYVMPGEDYRKKLEVAVNQKRNEGNGSVAKIWIEADEKYKDNFKILR